MMLCPSTMKARELQVMLGTVMRSSSFGLSMCHNLMSSSEQVANNSDVPLVEKQKKRAMWNYSEVNVGITICYKIVLIELNAC